MSREVSSRFANANNPKIYQFLYESFYKLFEKTGGINVTDARKMTRPGKKVVTANHDTFADPWVMGVVDPESLFSLGKGELGTWRYAFVGHWALKPLMNTTLITRTGRDYELLEQMANFMMDTDAAVQSYVYGTRRPEAKAALPKTGVAHLAIRSSTPENPTPILPFGHSMSVWRPGRPIQVVADDPIYAPEDGRQLKGGALKRARGEMTEKLVDSIGNLTKRAVNLDTARAGIPGKIRWND